MKSTTKVDDFTAREIRFINYVLQGYTNKEAASKAGYPESTCRAATSIAGKPNIKKEIARRKKIMVTRNDVTEDMIIEKLAQLAFTDLGDGLKFLDGEDGEDAVYWDLNKFKNIPALRAILANVKIEKYTEGRGKNERPFKRVQFSQKDQLKALELLMKHLGMFEDKVTVHGEVVLAERLAKGRERVFSDNSDEQSTETVDE